MTDSKIKVLWYWQAMGPYHFARMRALSRLSGINLTVVEGTSLDDHGWIRRETTKDLDLTTLSTKPLSPSVMREVRHDFAQILDKRLPDVVVIPGYAEAFSLQATLGYRNSCRDRLALVWSESTAIDHPRNRMKESLKSLIISAFDGALVAGSQHASYLRLLGMPAADIQIVGNCVDNQLFSDRAEEVSRGRRSDSVPANFFLFVGRMLPEKNVAGLLDAYQGYRQRAGTSAWDLVLVGSGPEETALKERIMMNDISGVHLTGLLQLDELSHYYGNAGCFVLPSISEPWGLVVNEAMASGLPVLVSNRCGCAPDLVREGQNGFVFDPLNTPGLTELLFKLSHGNVPLGDLGIMSKKIVAAYSPALFAQRVSAHIRFLSERWAGLSRSFSARQSLTRLALHGLGAMSTVRERLPAR